jgi:hypothetical protein
MKMYEGMELYVDPPFLTSEPDGGNGQAHAPAALIRGKELPVPFGYEVGWAPEPV